LLFARLDSDVPARDALKCAYAHCTEIRPPSGWRRSPERQGRPGCTRLVMVPQPPSAKNETLQSDVDIPGKRDWCYEPLPPPSVLMMMMIVVVCKIDAQTNAAVVVSLLVTFCVKHVSNLTALCLSWFCMSGSKDWKGDDENDRDGNSL